MAITNDLILLSPKGLQLGETETTRLERLTVSGGDRYAVTFEEGEYGIWTIPEVPASYQGNTLTLEVQCIAEATSGTVGFSAQVEAISPGDSLDLDSTVSFDTANTGTATVAGTAGYLFTVSITLTNADSLAVGDHLRIKLTRSDETASGTLWVLGARLFESVSVVDLTDASSVSVVALDASGVITSTVSTGTAPLTVASTTKVTNLNADLLDGLDSTAFVQTSDTTFVSTAPTSSGRNQIQSSADYVELTCKASIGQTVNVQEWKNENDQTKLAVSKSGVLVSSVGTGTSPITVTSTTVCTNLNADRLDGVEGTGYVTTAPSTSSRNLIITSSASAIPLSVKGASGQSVSLFEGYDFNSVLRWSLSAGGNTTQTGNCTVTGNITTTAGTITGGIVKGVSQNATDVPLVAKGATSQSANLMEWQNSSGTVLTQISSGGDIVWGNRTGYIGGATWGLTFSYSSGYLQGYFNFGKYRFSNVMSVSQAINWSSDAFNVASDVGIERSAAGILKITDASTGNGSLTASDVVGLSKLIARQSAGVAGTDEIQISHNGTSGLIENKDGNLTICTAPGTTGTVLTLVSSGGGLYIAGHSGVNKHLFNQAEQRLSSDISIGFSSSTTVTSASADIGLSRSAAGILKITDGSTGLGSLILGAYSASTIGLTVKGFSAQTANLQEWQNSSSTVLASVSSAGLMTQSKGEVASVVRGTWSAVTGVQTVTHNLNVASIVVGVYDNSGNMIIPDDVTMTSNNAVDIDLTSFGTFTGKYCITG